MPRLGSLLLLFVGFVCLVLLGALPARAGEHPDRPRSVGVGGQDQIRTALTLLHRWDRERARAYAEGSPSRLRRLYVAGSPAATADVRLLRRYTRRGLVRLRVHTQVFSAQLRGHRPGSYVLRVVERSYGSAVGRRRCLALPTSMPVTRTVSLHHVHGAWRVAAVSG